MMTTQNDYPTINELNRRKAKEEESEANAYIESIANTYEDEKNEFIAKMFFKYFNQEERDMIVEGKGNVLAARIIKKYI